MTEGITLVLPQDLEASEIERVREAVAGVDGVADVHPLDTRAIDIGAIVTWISFAADALSVATTASAAISAIFDRLRKLHVHGAVIELPNGVKITLDSATPDDIVRLVTEWKKEEALWMGGPQRGV